MPIMPLAKLRQIQFHIVQHVDFKNPFLRKGLHRSRPDSSTSNEGLCLGLVGGACSYPELGARSRLEFGHHAGLQSSTWHLYLFRTEVDRGFFATQCCNAT
mmetsp:Transcript_64084/g.134737  ORF Transcript_64084/g.134737 Transcript_64084/m.134737 type:complete len:101 (+) Transcript_64084:455-757(+)